jgi:hypothetical protein
MMQHMQAGYLGADLVAPLSPMWIYEAALSSSYPMNSSLLILSMWEWDKDRQS